MLILRKKKYYETILIILLAIYISKSSSEENLHVDNVGANKVTPEQINVNIQVEKADEKDSIFTNSEKLTSNKLNEGNHKEHPDDREENLFAAKDESEPLLKVIKLNHKLRGDVLEEVDRPSAPKDELFENNKPEAAQVLPKLSESKIPNENIQDNTRKISLSDVNSVTSGDGLMKAVKRDTRSWEFLGVPRDASYFFDDLEPYINNNSTKISSPFNSRLTRAIPTRDKVQKAKGGGKKGAISVEAEEEEEYEDDDEKLEDDRERAGEGEYDDDEDGESDSQHTSDKHKVDTEDDECAETDSTESTTTERCTTTRKTTSKCTTVFTCSTKCPTTEENTRCPKICVKPNRKSIGNKPTTMKRPEWDDLLTHDPMSTKAMPPILENQIKSRFRGKSKAGKVRE